MPGMNSGLNADDPTVVAAFRAALLHQGLIIAAIFAVLSIAWVAFRRPGPARAAASGPAGRRVLRIGFGLLWLLDGALQAQPGMAAGMPSQVIEPTASSSPPWVQHLVNLAGTTCPTTRSRLGGHGLDPGRYRPMAAGRATGCCPRLAGLASVGWGLVVWVFGRSFGGIFDRADLALRRAGRGPGVLRGRGAAHDAGAELAHAAAGPGSAGRVRCVPGRDGRAQAWPGRGSGRAAGTARSPAWCRRSPAHRGPGSSPAWCPRSARSPISAGSPSTSLP